MNKPGTLNRDSLNIVAERIRTACIKSGRQHEKIKIIAVTKTYSIKAIESAIKAGIYCIGENKTQELKTKIPLIKNRKKAEVHFIGHLQSNKVRKTLQYADVIQTVDSIKIAQRINKISKERKKTTSIYIQVNSGNDPNKFGFCKEDIYYSAEEISRMENIKLSGVMMIPPNSGDPQVLNDIFKKTKQHRDKISKSINKNCKNLSMGMSRDFDIAIKNGATHIRLGTILFGKRI